MKSSNSKPRLRTSLLPLLLSLGAAGLSGQPAPTAPASDQTAAAQQEQAVKLSPFVVQGENDTGYSSAQTLAGTRTVGDLDNLSTAITVINPQLISDLAAEDLQHVVGLGAAGITQNQWFVDDVMIRGFRANYSMIDGVTQNTYAPNPMYDKERVEIIEGPSAMVMGDNSFIGGAINFVFRPATPTPHTDLVFTATTDSLGVNYYRLQANNSGPIYTSKDFSANYRVTIGGTAGNMDQPEDDHHQRFIGSQVAMYFHEAKDLSLTLDAYYYINDDQYYFHDFLVPGSTGGIATLSPYSTRTKAITTSAANLQTMNETLIHATLLDQLTEHDNIRAFFSYVDYYLDEAQAYATGFVDAYHLSREFTNYYEKDLQWTVQADFVDKRKFVDGLIDNTFTAGIDHRDFYQPAGEWDVGMPSIDIRLNPDPIINGDAAIAAQANADLATKQYTDYATKEYVYTTSYYVEDRLNVWKDRVFVSGGYRWYRASATNQDLTTSNGPAETDYAPFTAENLGIVLKPTSWLSAYYSHVTTTIPVPGFGIPISGPPFPFVPSTGKDNEVGLKLDYKISQKLSLYSTFDHFYEELTNVRTPLPYTNAQTGQNVILQSASNNSYGWEWTLGGRVSMQSFDFDTIITGYRADVHSAINNGNWATRAVGQTFSMLGKVTLKQGGPLKGSFIGLGGYETGRKYDGNFIELTPNIYKMFVGYPINKWWNLQFNWDNMTNKRTISEIYSGGAMVEVGPAGEMSVSTRFHW